MDRFRGRVKRPSPVSAETLEISKQRLTLIPGRPASRWIKVREEGGMDPSSSSSIDPSALRRCRLNARRYRNRSGLLSFVMDSQAADVHIGPINTSIMINTLLLVLALNVHAPTTAGPIGTVQHPGNDVLVVMHIEGLDDAMYARFVKVVAGQRAASVEYGCVWSGIVVVKLNDTPFTERADMVTYVKRLTDDAGIKMPVEVLHTHFGSTGPGKC